MDVLLISQIAFLALIISFAAGAFSCWQKRKYGLTILCGVLMGVCGVGLVTWPYFAGQPSARQRPQPQPESQRQSQPTDMTLATFERFRPIERATAGYTASDACRECHPENHRSWHASYHRTMTQLATPDAVIANFDNVHVRLRERDYSLQQQGDVCWVEMYDPDFPPSPATQMKVPILMTTGSHHMQIYWYPSGVARTMGQLPIIFLKETQQWIPRASAFLKPISPVSSEMGRWNDGCSDCHSTHKRERQIDPATWDTQITEFGISCEACHGPGEDHIAFHRNLNVRGDDPIVNPSDLSSKLSSQVCGQCHSVHSFREKNSVLQAQGHGYRPGKDLSDTHDIWRRDSEVVRNFLKRRKFKEGDEAALRRMYWDDGMIRVSGREFNGLTDSACHQSGELSCFSCHSMHQHESDERSLTAWADDQLSPVGMSDRACTQCHQADQYGSSHSHHSDTSSGARCYNCHMPHTTYGLLKAIRSHTISSPQIEQDLKAGRPNACNLCHLDKTLKWSAEAMNQWYGDELPNLSEEQETVAASVLWLLKSDAGGRALAGWSMGWAEAQKTSGSDWIAPLLAQLLNDPYDAVRFIGRRSMRSLPGLQDFRFNALWPQQQRLDTIESVRRDWHQRTENNRRAESQILIDETGLDERRVADLLKQRDDRKVDLAE